MKTSGNAYEGENRSLHMKERIGYGVGDFANNMMYTPVNSFFTYFLTNVAGLGAGVVGTILLVSRLLDGVSDLIVGSLMEKIHSKHGKARPWLLWWCIPFAVSLVLMFTAPDFGTTGKIVYAFLTYNLAVTVVYTAINGIRFMPQSEGTWNYTVHSNDPDLDGAAGSFVCTPAGENNHGRVCLKKDVVPKKEVNPHEAEDEFHFAYEDGTRFRPFGTTCYAWINQPEEIQLETLKNAPFKKIRMCIFPKFYSYNTEDPENYAFEGNAEDGFEHTRFNNTFFEKLEKMIADLDELGIEADIILLHPYDRWGFSKLTREQDMFYLSYVVRRLSAFKNVWWSHGVKLYGESTEHIGFLKKILAEVPEDDCTLTLTPENHEENWDSVCLHENESYFLCYYGFFRPLYRNYTLPEGKKYRITLIDTWNMTEEELPEIYEGKIRIKMGARQYMAVRMQEVK